MSSEHRERLSEYGIPVDAVEGLVQDAVEKRMQRFGQELGAVQQIAADPWMVSHAEQIANFVASDPRRSESYNRLNQADPQAALEYATGLYRASTGGRPAGDGLESWTKETRMLMPGVPSAQQQQPPPVSHPVYGNGNAVEQARAEYNRTGTREAARQYAKARLKTVIDENWLRQ